jgi:hypothetical protein
LDRQTPMFLPCDLREWVPAEHIVHFILVTVHGVNRIMLEELLSLAE